MNERLNDNLRRLFDGELDPNDMRRVLRDAAEDEEGLALLGLEFRVRRTFGEQRAGSVPMGFADRVMKQVHLQAEATDPSPAAAAKGGSWLSRLLEALVTPRPVVLRPGYAMAVLAVLAFGVVLVLGRQEVTPSQPAGIVDENVASMADGASAEVLVPFVYVSSDAASVGVAGDFNNWEPTRLQRKELNGRIVWTGHIPVTRGEHRYMFVVDGNRWESDPLAPVQRDDGFGNTNAILAL